MTSEDDLVRRCGLLADELDMGGANVAQMTASLRDALGASAISDALSHARTEPAIDAIQWFATAEADLASSDLKGLGRVSAQGFPRLGGVLAREATWTAAGQVDLLHAVERSVHASYLATLLAVPGLHRQPARTDVQEIWEQWIPGSYAVPDEIFQSTASMCAFETFWERLFDRWDVKKLRKQLRKRGSDVGRSLGGLAGVGVALAFSERDTASVNATSDV